MPIRSTVDIGDVARVAFVFTDNTGALETPTSFTIDVQAPDGTTSQVDQDNANVNTGVTTWPLPLRETLAAQLSGLGITAANLTAGTGCVEYLHTPTAAGVWRYHAKATAPTTSADQRAVYVRGAYDV